MLSKRKTTSSSSIDALSWRERLRRPDLWKDQLIDGALWLVLGLMVTHVIALAIPGYPQFIWTDSIKRGVYWVDRTDGNYAREKYVAFDFRPKLKYLDERYGQQRRHAKQIVGVEGDVVRVDENWVVEVCHPTYEGAQVCLKKGQVNKRDSIGRPMQSWVAPGTSYTLKQGELWVMGEHPQSLDSRYDGPIGFSQVKGTARLVIPFD